MSQVLALDPCLRWHDNNGSALNSAGSFSRLNTLADNRRQSGFFTSVNTIVTPSMAGAWWGSLRACRFQCAGLLTLPCTRHPHLAVRGGLLNPTLEAITMPKLARALLSHLSFAAILLAAYNHAPLIVVLLAVMMLALVHLVGAPK